MRDFELSQAKSANYFNRVLLLVVILNCLLFLFPKYVISSPEQESPTADSSWNLETILDRSSSRVTGVGFSPDDRYVAYMEKSGRVYIHRVGGDWPLVKIFYEPDIHIGGDVEFSPDGKWFVYGLLKENRDAVLQVINVEDWTKDIRKTHSSQSGRSAGTLINLQFSDDNKWLVSGTNSNHCFVWDVKNDFSLVHVFNPGRYGANPSQAAISDDGKYLLITSSTNAPTVYKIGTWKKVTVLKNLPYSGAPAFGENNEAFFADRSNNWWVYVPGPGWTEVVEREAARRVIRSGFSNSGRWLALADAEGHLEIIGTVNWQRKIVLKEAKDIIGGISFSAADDYLAYTSRDNNVYIHSVPKQYCEISERDDNYLELIDLDSSDISELNLEFNEDKSTLTIHYGDKSELALSYGEGSSLMIEDTPGGKLKIELKLK